MVRRVIIGKKNKDKMVVTKMAKDIKFKLLQLGKKQVDLLRALRDMGQKVSPQELSCFISGVVQTPKSEAVLKIARDILKEWEVKQDDPKNC